MNDPLSDRWEIGSEYDWREEFVTFRSTNPTLPETFELFATARDSLVALASTLHHAASKPRLYLPSYYCFDVSAGLSVAYDVCWYRDLPTDSEPDFASFHPQPGDVVLALNRFGVQSGQRWNDWHADHQGVVLIEDHSHDPFSAWARNSLADFAMASLRKTMPLPDGGIIWSPIQKQLPRPSSCTNTGAEFKLSAMILKHCYLQGRDINKDAFRDLQRDGETKLVATSLCAASNFTQAVIRSLDIDGQRQRRRANVRDLLTSLQNVQTHAWQMLFDSWPRGHTPLGVVLLCKDSETRHHLREWLSEHHVYCPVHWPVSEGCDVPDVQLVTDISRRILTIPLDQRYDSADVSRVFSLLAGFAARIAMSETLQKNPSVT